MGATDIKQVAVAIVQTYVTFVHQRIKEENSAYLSLGINQSLTRYIDVFDYTLRKFTEMPLIENVFVPFSIDLELGNLLCTVVEENGYDLNQRPKGFNEFLYRISSFLMQEVMKKEPINYSTEKGMVMSGCM